MQIPYIIQIIKELSTYPEKLIWIKTEQGLVENTKNIFSHKKANWVNSFVKVGQIFLIFND